jgi:hypothetical protein
MGILSSRLRAESLSLWEFVRGWLVVPLFAPNACRGERCGVWGRTAPSKLVGWFVFWSVSSSASGRAFFSVFPGNLLSASAPAKERGLHYDLFGSGRGTSTLNLQNEFFLEHSAALTRVRRSKVSFC